MFIRQALSTVGKRFLNQSKTIAFDNSHIMQWLVFTTMNNYIYKWITQEQQLPYFSVTSQKVLANAQRSKKILVLDMDETLLYTRRTERPSHRNYIQTDFEGQNMYIQTRPHSKEFLQKASELFILYIYTAGNRKYADKVLNNIDPEHLIQRRFYRDSCKTVNGKVIKDLKYLKKVTKTKKDMILVDDNVDSINNNYPFALRIKPFEGCQSDKELPQIFNNLLKFYQ